MKNTVTIKELDDKKEIGYFEPEIEKLKNSLLKQNGRVQKIFAKANKDTAPMDLQNSLIQELLKLAKKPEDWLEICFFSEQNNKVDHENLWLAGLEKFNGSALYLENLGYFYFQKTMYHKALDYLSRSHALEKSFFALSLAIASAYAITQYHLVMEYFSILSMSDKKKLNEDLLMKVATSALHQNQFDLSIEIFESIRKKNKIQPLPGIQDHLIKKFGSSDKIMQWSNSMDNQVQNKKNRSTLSMEECITYASILIYQDKYQSALEHLLTIKEERFS
ncbi:MAG: hypothetical protein OEV66_09410 [Spirochaetia bacterium]|nr:hypothetical protein [Spirochaetia bacterium]